jgi:hypothetical protein
MLLGSTLYVEPPKPKLRLISLVPTLHVGNPYENLIPNTSYSLIFLNSDFSDNDMGSSCGIIKYTYQLKGGKL